MSNAAANPIMGTIFEVIFLCRKNNCLADLYLYVLGYAKKAFLVLCPSGSWARVTICRYQKCFTITLNCSEL